MRRVLFGEQRFSQQELIPVETIKCFSERLHQARLAPSSHREPPRLEETQAPLSNTFAVMQPF